MRILILDDDEYRHMHFAKEYEGHKVTHAWTYTQFLNSLTNASPWDLIHLDHDLGDMTMGDTYVDGWGNTREYNGQHAAQRICELDDATLPQLVIIQSVNPQGAVTMRSMLQRRGVPVTWEPFGESAAFLESTLGLKR